MKYCDYC